MASYRELAGAVAALCRAIRAGNVRPGSALVAQAEKLVGEAMAGKNSETPWTPFVAATGRSAPFDALRAAAARFNVSDDLLRKMVDDQSGVEIWINSRYQVLRRPSEDGRTIYLSVKRLDQEPIRSWRDLQRIKTELVGAECEGVELFPAESRLTDTSNQYHLWVLADPAMRLPFGFDEGRVVGDDFGGAAGQEPLTD